jgi:hypothetical protein
MTIRRGLLAQTWSIRSPSRGLLDTLLHVQARECMLDTEAFTRLGLSEHNLVRPPHQVRPSGLLICVDCVRLCYA